MFGPLPRTYLLWPALIVLVGILMPFVAGNYILYIVGTLMMYCVLALGFEILVGWAGQFAFSHVAFFGLGAYGTALLQKHFGVTFVIGVIVCAALSSLISCLIALASVRMRHVYLALATFSFAQAAYFVFQSWNAVTNGADGLRLPSPQIFGYSISGDRQSFPVLAVIFALALIATLYLRQSKLGRSMAAIRDSEHVAAMSGIDVQATKVKAFVISSVYASVGGTMLNLLNSYINPDNFGFTLTIMLLTMIAIGGMGSIPGALIGAVVVGLIPEVLRNAMQSVLIWQELIYGVILGAAVMFLPRGIWGFIEPRLVRRRKA